MICTTLNPMIALWGCIFIFWGLLLSSPYRKERDAKEALMLEEAMKTLKELQEKNNGN